jgi:hypothetical protein
VSLADEWFTTFLTVAADLYATDPKYRADLEAEREPSTEGPGRSPNARERLDELEWLIRNGMEFTLAVETVGYSLTTAQRTAHRLRHPVMERITQRDDGTISGKWAKRWLAGHRVA